MRGGFADAATVGLVAAALFSHLCAQGLAAADSGVAASDDRPPTVVLDPGHGGGNTGAPSLNRHLYEKDFTLALAHDVEVRLRRRGVEVGLTRTRDHYLTLRERVRRANELAPDLLISLHANATETHSQAGFETYVLSADAVAVDSPALRHGDGPPRDGLGGNTASILDQLEHSIAQEKAAAVAHAIQRRMRRLRGARGDRGVRQDSMHVLLGATMPAVLVEVGFLDHPVEGRELLDPDVRHRIADALVDAVCSSGVLAAPGCRSL